MIQEVILPNYDTEGYTVQK